jgi:hypothetical protein
LCDDQGNVDGFFNWGLLFALSRDPDPKEDLVMMTRTRLQICLFLAVGALRGRLHPATSTAAPTPEKVRSVERHPLFPVSGSWNKAFGGYLPKRVLARLSLSLSPYLPYPSAA